MRHSLSHTPSPVVSSPQAIWIVALGWILFFVLWTLFILGWGRGEVTLADASVSGIFTTFSASILGYLVWRMTAIIVWPESLQVRFLLIHLASAIVFTGLWTAMAPIMGVLWEGGSISDMDWDMQVYTWRLFMGTWLYFIVAGLSYAARISGRLRQQQQVAARAEALAAQANLDAMRSRLHPHFLFNALHSVSALIETDTEKATEAMEKLGDLLRYAIRDRDSGRVSLAEEWDFVQDYVELQCLRFGERAHVDLQIDDSIKGARVPAFVLQPLVENAFVHGIGPKPEGGNIRITAKRDDEHIRFHVEDDGSGLKRSDDTPIGGSGIDNLRARLKALYAEESLLELSGRDGSGTRAMIMIPFEEE